MYSSNDPAHSDNLNDENQYQHEACSNNSARHQRQYYWAQPHPKSLETVKVPLFCNGKRIGFRHWRADRCSHRNKAMQYAKAAEYRLRHLPRDYKLATGYLKLPKNATIEDWRKAKSDFKRLLKRFLTKHNLTFEFIAKQHVTLTANGDAVHYDYIAYHDCQYSTRWLRMNILQLWYKAAKCYVKGCSLTDLDSPISSATEYIFKYASKSGDYYDSFMRRFPLPATRLPVTWHTKGFWGCKTQEILCERYYNGDFESKRRLLTPMQQHWMLWIASKSSQLAYFETQAYRDTTALEAKLDDLLDTQSPELEDVTKLTHAPLPLATTSPRILRGEVYLQSKSLGGQQTTKGYDMTYQPPDRWLNKHHEIGTGQFWLMPLHKDGKPTGRFRIATHDRRHNCPATNIKTKDGRTSFTQSEIQKIIAYKGWRLPSRCSIAGWQRE